MSIWESVKQGAIDELLGVADIRLTKAFDPAYQLGRNLFGDEVGRTSSSSEMLAEPLTERHGSAEERRRDEKALAHWNRFSHLFVLGIQEAICAEVWDCTLADIPTMLTDNYDPCDFVFSEDHRMMGGFFVHADTQDVGLIRINHVLAVAEGRYELNMRASQTLRRTPQLRIIRETLVPGKKARGQLKKWLASLPAIVLETAKGARQRWNDSGPESVRSE